MAGIREKTHSYKAPVGTYEEEHHSEDLRVDGMIILKWLLNRVKVTEWINFAQDTVRGWALLENGKKLSGSTQCHQFLD